MAKIEKRPLNHTDKELKKEDVKGVIWHCLPKYYNQYVGEGFDLIDKENKKDKNYGFHYLISADYIFEMIDEKYQTCNIDEKQTYISNNLFKSKPNEHCISICFLFHPNVNYTVTEKTLIEKTIEILKKYNLTAKDIWRGFDLSKDTYSPFHALDKSIFEKYIAEVEKFLPPKEESKPDDKDENKTKDDKDKNKTDEKKEEKQGTDKDKKDEKSKDTKDKVPEKPFNPDEVVSPFKEVADAAKLTINEYIDKIYKDNKGKEKEYAAKFQPWDKGLEEAKKGNGKNGELKEKTYEKTNNTLQYKITEVAPDGTCECVKASDNLDANETPKEIMVEPIYPDLITPPGEQITIADGTSSSSVPSNSNAPLTVEEFEKRQKRFSLENFDKVQKTTIGRPVNCDDEFPVDEQIKKLEQHFPKIKIDKTHFNFDEDNHTNSLLGKAMAKNYAMCYDMIMEESKRVETRLVKIENNLSTVMRNLFRLSSRININCVYYGGQSVYGKYKCIRCLQDDRINDGAVVSLDQCLSCTRYEPILGQVYAILDDAGTNVTQIIDDMQMSYMGIDDYNELTRIEEYHNSPGYTYLTKNPSKTPEPFNKNKWKDTEKEIKAKGKKPEDAKKEDYKNGFVMNWSPVQLETQSPNINKYKAEDKKLNKEETNSTTQGIDRELYVDTRKDNESYETLEFDIKDYEFPDFGCSSSSDSTDESNFGMGAAEVRKKIVEYMEKVKKKSEQGKVYYSQGSRLQYGNPDKLDKIDYYDCSSLVGAAYMYAGIACLNKGWTEIQYPKYTKKQGGMLIPIKDVKKALPGDVIIFARTGDKVPTTQEGLENYPPKNTEHTAIYVGDGKYLDIGRQHPNPKDNVKYKPVQGFDKRIMAFCRPKELIKLDNEAASSGTAGSAPEQWTREYHQIPDKLWNRCMKHYNMVGRAKETMNRMKKYGYKDIILKYSKEKGLDPYMVLGVIATESTGNPQDGLGKYGGLMACENITLGTSKQVIDTQIKKGCEHIIEKANAIKPFGWKAPNWHVVLNAYNSGQALPIDAKKKYGCDLATVKIPKMSDAVREIAKGYKDYDIDEKWCYTTQVLIAYNECKKAKALE